jgi:hypothetical protein
MRQWERTPGRRAKSLDCMVYAMAVKGLVGKDVDRREEEVASVTGPERRATLVRSKWLGRNSEGPCQSWMRPSGMKLQHHRRFPAFGVAVVRRRNQFGFDLALSRRERLAEAWNGERPGENGNSLSGQVFHGRGPLSW